MLRPGAGRGSAKRRDCHQCEYCSHDFMIAAKADDGRCAELPLLLFRCFLARHFVVAHLVVRFLVHFVVAYLVIGLLGHFVVTHLVAHLVAGRRILLFGRHFVVCHLVVHLGGAVLSHRGGGKRGQSQPKNCCECVFFHCAFIPFRLLCWG